MWTRRIHWTAVAALAVGVAIVAFAACGKGKHPASGLISTPESTAAALEAVLCPEGVDAGLWVELKDALKEALAKTASTPPTGNDNKVADLGIADNGDGTYTLSWHYLNLGDYNQNGRVGIEDITPLAQHYGETWSVGEEDTLTAVIDGSGNGKVGIEDVTPIAQCFQREVHHYAVQGSHLFNGPFVDMAEPTLPEGAQTARVELAYDLGVPPYLNWRVVPFDSDGNAGPASNVAVVSEAPPPAVRILSINPLGGVTGAEVTFTATVTGDPPLSYSWDFGGGAAPNESIEPSPTVTLGDVGAYSASLRVENAPGSAIRSFTLTVSAEPGEPPQIISVSPTEGDSGTEATFTAEVTGDGPLEYSWNFGGGASPNQSSGPAPTVTLSRGGTLPDPVRTYPATLTVTNPYGSAVQDFDLNISAWWHLLEIPFEYVHVVGLAPEGQPALLRGTEVDVRYDVWNGQSWEEEVLPPATYGTLAYSPVDGEPRALAARGGWTVGNIIYSWRSSGQWYSEEVSLGEGWVVPFSTGLAFRSGGQPVACWSLVTGTSKVRVARRNAQGWKVESLPTPGVNAKYPSVFIDQDGKAVVLFTSQITPPSIWLAREEAAGWKLEQVLADCDGMIAAPAPDRKLGLIAESEGNDVVVFAEQSAGGWDVSEVCAEEWPWVLWTRGFAFTASGQPVVLYTQENQLTEEVQHFFAWPEAEGWGRRQLPQADWPPEDYWWSLWFLGFTPEGSAVLYTATMDPTARLFPTHW